jgi:hypothetical protein
MGKGSKGMTDRANLTVTQMLLILLVACSLLVENGNNGGVCFQKWETEDGKVSIPCVLLLNESRNHMSTRENCQNLHKTKTSSQNSGDILFTGVGGKELITFPSMDYPFGVETVPIDS